MTLRVVFREDARDSAKSIATRRSRLAKVVKAFLNTRRAKNQTLDQMHSAGNAVNFGPIREVPKSLNRLSTLAQRHDGLRSKSGRLMRRWAKASLWQVMKNLPHRKVQGGIASRPRIDAPTRPANPRTYGKGKDSHKDFFSREKP